MKFGLAILCLLATGCATVNTMVSAGTSFKEQVKEGKVQGIGSTDPIEISSHETAVAGGGLKCVIIHVWPKQTNQEKQYVLLQLPGEHRWRMAATDDLDKTPLTSIPQTKQCTK